MNFQIKLFFALILFVFAMCGASLAKTNQIGRNYDEQEIYDWKVYIEKDLKEHPKTLAQMLAKLKQELGAVRLKVPEKQLRVMQEANFWLVLRHKHVEGFDADFEIGGLFITSKDWLQRHGEDKRKYFGIQLDQAYATPGFSNTAFHELSHYLHARQTDTLDHKLKKLFDISREQAKTARDSCRITDDGRYAFYDIYEFFAVFSSAFVFKSCHHPRNANVIRVTHPEMYDFLVQIWQKS